MLIAHLDLMQSVARFVYDSRDLLAHICRPIPEHWTVDPAVRSTWCPAYPADRGNAHVFALRAWSYSYDLYKHPTYWPVLKWTRPTQLFLDHKGWLLYIHLVWPPQLFPRPPPSLILLDPRVENIGVQDVEPAVQTAATMSSSQSKYMQFIIDKRRYSLEMTYRVRCKLTARDRNM